MTYVQLFQLRPNFSVKRTSHGMPALALISFWAKATTP
jgi:hypothetical protein